MQDFLEIEWPFECIISFEFREPSLPLLWGALTWLYAYCSKNSNSLRLKHNPFQKTVVSKMASLL